MTPTLLYIIAAVAAIPAAYFGWKYIGLILARVDRSQHTGTLAAVGIPLMIIAGCLGYAKTLGEFAEREVIEVAATKYAVTIEEYNWSTELSDWKINGQVTKCLVADDKIPAEDPVVKCVGANGDMSGEAVELPTGAEILANATQNGVTP